MPVSLVKEYRKAAWLIAGDVAPAGAPQSG